MLNSMFGSMNRRNLVFAVNQDAEKSFKKTVEVDRLIDMLRESNSREVSGMIFFVWCLPACLALLLIIQPHWVTIAKNISFLFFKVSILSVTFFCKTGLVIHYFSNFALDASNLQKF